MFKSIKRLFDKGGSVDRPLDQVDKAAAAALPPPDDPKVRSRDQVSVPSYLKTAKTSGGTKLPETDRNVLNTDLTTYRNNGTSQAIRDFVMSSPDLSASVFAYLRVAITRSYKAVSKNMDGSYSPEGTALLHQLITRFDILPNYADGFSGTSSMRSNSESLGRSIMIKGAMAAELVLNKARLPVRIQPIDVSQIKFKQDGKILRPVQTVAGTDIDLDIPTFFYVSLDQDLLDAYSSSPLEPALKAVLASEDFQNDIRRIVKRVIHPRLDIKINEERFLSTLSAAVKSDEGKLAEARNSIIEEIRASVEGLNPEDALIYFDSIGISLTNNGNASLSQEYSVLADMNDSKLATGAKAMPAILGHGSESANIASTETMLFAKSAEGAVQAKLNELYSKMLTLALRLFGLDVYAEFAYDPVDLRPQSELEAFYSTRQSRVLDLLSLGLISDDEACITLTGRLPPAGYKPLSGTMFRTMKAAVPQDQTSNGGSALNQSQKSDAPTEGRGQNNRRDPVKAEVFEFQQAGH